MAEGFLALSHDWQIIYANPVAKTLLTPQDGQLDGKNIFDVCPGLHSTRFQSAYRRVAAHQIAETLVDFHPHHHRWYELRICPASHGISIYFNDISESKCLEAERMRLAAECERQKRIYETALSNSADFNYLFDLAGRLTHANEALLALWKKKLPEVVGKNFFDLAYPPALAERLQRQIAQVIDTGQRIQDNMHYPSALGERQYEYIFVPVMDARGRAVAVSGSTRDVTEPRECDQAQPKSDQRKDEFLAILAHELRNPLASLNSWLEVLRQAGGNQELAEKAPPAMARQVGQLVRLVDDLMDWSRVTQGMVELRKAPVQLAALLQQALETVQHFSDRAGHQLELHLPPDELMVEVDAARIVQAVTNLLNNAIKFTSPGGYISLSARREGSHAVVCVADNGIGIAQDMQARVFDIFTHADDSMGRAHGGLGIGLSLVKGFVELHDGTVEVHSEGHGKGSRFTVRLPLLTPLAAGSTGSASSAGGVRQSGPVASFFGVKSGF
ncbi:MAG: hypothetical protein JWR60_2885 [Polaromonas sp.]|nr:hypothetical protein [Polaromonas sp.]